MSLAKMRRPGLSRVDVLVVLAITAVGLGVLLPAVHALQGRDAAKQTVNNLKQICLAIHNFDGTFKKLPPAYGWIGNFKGGGIGVSIHIHLLPFVEQEKLHLMYYDKDKKVPAVVVPQFIAKLDPSLKDKEEVGIQNFPANLRVFADAGVATKYDKDMPALGEIAPGASRLVRTITDGTSNTIAFSTKYAYCGDGGSRYDSRPNAKTAAFFGQNAAKKKAHASDKEAAFQIMPSAKVCLCSPLIAQSFLPKEIHVGLADGSVRTVSSNISVETWNRAVQPNDGKPLGDDW
ncbi:MAG: DUF1559 domain-containing protein [Planctomycetes bacterium]|nr:DUF1559 domain-containing protein [Planctomycetota bacterium]